MLAVGALDQKDDRGYPSLCLAANATLHCIDT